MRGSGVLCLQRFSVVGGADRVRLAIKRCAGEKEWSRGGLFRMLRSARWTSPHADYFNIDLASFTAASALPFLCGQYGDDVTCSKPYVFANICMHGVHFMIWDKLWTVVHKAAQLACEQASLFAGYSAVGYRDEQNGLLRGFVRIFCFLHSWQRRLGWLYHGRTQGVLGVRPESFTTSACTILALQQLKTVLILCSETNCWLYVRFHLTLFGFHWEKWFPCHVTSYTSKNLWWGDWVSKLNSRLSFWGRLTALRISLKKSLAFVRWMKVIQLVEISVVINRYEVMVVLKLE